MTPPSPSLSLADGEDNLITPHTSPPATPLRRHFIPMILTGREGRRRFEVAEEEAKRWSGLLRMMEEDAAAGAVHLPGIEESALDVFVAFLDVCKSAGVGEALERADPSRPDIPQRAADFISAFEEARAAQAVATAAYIDCQALCNLASWRYAELLRARLGL